MSGNYWFPTPCRESCRFGRFLTTRGWQTTLSTHINSKNTRRPRSRAKRQVLRRLRMPMSPLLNADIPEQEHQRVGHLRFSLAA